jgi:hypothetical protein
MKVTLHFASSSVLVPDILTANCKMYYYLKHVDNLNCVFSWFGYLIPYDSIIVKLEEQINNLN